MTCHDLTIGAVEWRFCPEDPIPDADRTRSIVRGRFVDELTDRPLVHDLEVATETAGLTPRVATGGIAGLTGNPARRYPGLAAGTVTIDLSVSARRFVTRRFAVDLGPIPGYPGVFAPADLGDVAMHRAATRLLGRVMQNSGLDRVPLDNVDVEIVGFWSRFPPPDVDPLTVIEAPNLCAVAPGLYAARTSGADTVTARDLVAAAGEEKTLLAPLVAGSRELELSDRINLNSGAVDVLAIEPGHPDRAEFILIDAVEGASTDDQPATVSLIHACAWAHPEGATAVRVVPQAPAGPNAITRDAIAGDRSVFLSALSGLAGADTVEIAGSGDPEYQRVALYRTTSDPRGDWHLPPLSRVAQVRLEASRFDLPQPERSIVSPDYDQYEFRTDIVFPQ